AASAAYLELFFHTHEASVAWFEGCHGEASDTCTPNEGLLESGILIGAGVDDHLGNPRRLSSFETHPLDDIPGFGLSADSMLRDDTIAYWEAFQREQLVVECLADEGFSYVADVAYPDGPFVALASNLGVAADDGAGSETPAEANAAYLD